VRGAYRVAGRLQAVKAAEHAAAATSAKMEATSAVGWAAITAVGKAAVAAVAAGLRAAPICVGCLQANVPVATFALADSATATRRCVQSTAQE